MKVKKIIQEHASWIKIILSVIICFYAWYLIRERIAASQIEQYADFLLEPQELSLLLILMVINWGIEALKWQVVVRPVQSISYWTAYKSVLSGLSMGLISPRMVGEVFGRVWLLRTRKRFAALGAIMLNRIFQLAATVILGLLGFYHLKQVGLLADQSVEWGIWILAGLSVFAAVALFWVSRFHRRVVHSRLRRVTFLFSMLGHYKFSTLGLLLALSILRYTVFALQFGLILHQDFCPQVGWALFSFVTVFYLIKTFIPSVNFLGDVGSRSVLTFWLFVELAGCTPGVVVASTWLWFVNIMLPSLLGVPFVFKYKFTLSK